MNLIPFAKIEQIAPDQGSLDAARKLLKPTIWPTLATDDAGLVWGECQGSGSSPYRVVISEEDAGYKCTCPSRKFPCKHCLALMWMRAEGKTAFSTGTPPDWVADWLSRRRASGSTPAETDEKRPQASIRATDAIAEEDIDPKAEARAAAQRERIRIEREASILMGLDELDLWLSDQLSQGLASFPSVAIERCRMVARRLVDAKAGGLASRVEALMADLFTVPDQERAEWLMTAFGKLHLIAEAYRRQDLLPEDLRADVRQATGWTLAREALLANPQAPRVTGRWLVLAATQVVQPDKVRRMETWLARCTPGDGPAFALLMDFIPVSAGAVGKSYAVGENFEAELVFYPSAVPLRALICTQTSALNVDPVPWIPPHDLTAAIEAFERSMARRPWLDMAPFGVSDAVVRTHGEAFWLTDPAGKAGVRLKGGEFERPLAETTIDAAFGLFDGRELRLKFPATPIGTWIAA